MLPLLLTLVLCAAAPARGIPCGAINIANAVDLAAFSLCDTADSVSMVVTGAGTFPGKKAMLSLLTSVSGNVVVRLANSAGSDLKAVMPALEHIGGSLQISIADVRYSLSVELINLAWVGRDVRIDAPNGRVSDVQLGTSAKGGANVLGTLAVASTGASCDKLGTIALNAHHIHRLELHGCASAYDLRINVLGLGLGSNLVAPWLVIDQGMVVDVTGSFINSIRIHNLVGLNAPAVAVAGGNASAIQVLMDSADGGHLESIELNTPSSSSRALVIGGNIDVHNANGGCCWEEEVLIGSLEINGLRVLQGVMSCHASTTQAGATHLPVEINAVSVQDPLRINTCKGRGLLQGGVCQCFPGFSDLRCTTEDVCDVEVSGLDPQQNDAKPYRLDNSSSLTGTLWFVPADVPADGGGDDDGDGEDGDSSDSLPILRRVLGTTPDGATTSQWLAVSNSSANADVLMVSPLLPASLANPAVAGWSSLGQTLSLSDALAAVALGNLSAVVRASNMADPTNTAVVFEKGGGNGGPCTIDNAKKKGPKVVLMVLNGSFSETFAANASARQEAQESLRQAFADFNSTALNTTLSAPLNVSEIISIEFTADPDNPDLTLVEFVVEGTTATVTDFEKAVETKTITAKASGKVLRVLPISAAATGANPGSDGTGSSSGLSGVILVVVVAIVVVLVLVVGVSLVIHQRKRSRLTAAPAYDQGEGGDNVIYMQQLLGGGVPVAMREDARSSYYSVAGFPLDKQGSFGTSSGGSSVSLLHDKFGFAEIHYAVAKNDRAKLLQLLQMPSEPALALDSASAASATSPPTTDFSPDGMQPSPELYPGAAHATSIATVAAVSAVSPSSSGGDAPDTMSPGSAQQAAALGDGCFVSSPSADGDGLARKHTLKRGGTPESDIGSAAEFRRLSGSDASSPPDQAASSMRSPGAAIAAAQQLAVINVQDKQGNTALIWAIRTGNMELLKVLLEAGADANLANRQGRNALHFACLWESSKEMCERLLSAGADVNKVDEEGMTPLMYACRQGQVETTTILLSHGAHLMSAGDRGITPLMLAASQGHASIVRYLMKEPDQRSNVRDLSGWTALHWAAAMDEGECIAELLASPSTEVLAADERGSTFLHVAAREGNLAVVEALKACESRFVSIAKVVGAKDHEQQTAYDLAASLGHTEVQELLATMPGCKAKSQSKPAAADKVAAAAAPLERGPSHEAFADLALPDFDDADSGFVIHARGIKREADDDDSGLDDSVSNRSASVRSGEKVAEDEPEKDYKSMNAKERRAVRRREYMRNKRARERETVERMESKVEQLEKVHDTLAAQIQAMRAEAAHLKALAAQQSIVLPPASPPLSAATSSSPL